MPGPITRREAIKTTLAAGAGIVLSSSSARAVEWIDASKASKPARGGAFRFAHLTDIHIQPERHAGEGYARALESLHRLNPMPQIVVTGGDHVMDSTGKPLKRCELEWNLYARVMHDHATLPTYPAIGNHDVAGWGAGKDFTPEMPGYGKAMVIDRLKIANPSYGFDAGGWRIIILDSITQRNDSYFGALGEAQTHWLANELKRIGTKTPICIVSHIPIMSVASFFDGDRLQDNKWQIPDAWVHRDMKEIVNLIEPYNVRLLLSGHLHLLDRCEYRGKTYICDGAVCGNWWKGSYNGCPEGYGVIDIWPDGNFEHQYVTYGWKAEPEK